MTEAIEMAGYVRLRQICLVAPHLEPAVGDIAGIMGLNVCYRDGNVAKYGLENALLPVDTILLEVVAPIEPGTAAGRFLDKTGGRGGYMAIFCCDDPDQRGRHATEIGVRTANVIDHAPYHGVQLHPRDCRAAFIEFNHTDGTQALAEHWGKIIGIPVSKSKTSEPELALPNCSFNFVKGASDIMSGLTFRVGDIAAVRDAAKAKGRPVSGDSFLLGGVTFRLIS